MDQAALVKERIDGGEKLIRHVRDRGLELTGGLWTRADSDARDYLYLVAPAVEDSDPRLAYREITKAQVELENGGLDWAERIDPFGIKLISPRHPLAKAVFEHYHDFAGSGPSWFHGAHLGSRLIEDAFIYPPSLFQTAAAELSAN